VGYTRTFLEVSPNNLGYPQNIVVIPLIIGDVPKSFGNTSVVIKNDDPQNLRTFPKSWDVLKDVETFPKIWGRSQ